MKPTKIIFTILASVILCTAAFSQGYNRDELKRIWAHRYVPSQENVDSTFNSLWVFDNDGTPIVKDTFLYANQLTYSLADHMGDSSLVINVDSMFFSGSAFMGGTLFGTKADSATHTLYNSFTNNPLLNFTHPNSWYIDGYIAVNDTFAPNYVKFRLFAPGTVGSGISSYVTLPINTIIPGEWTHFRVKIFFPAHPLNSTFYGNYIFEFKYMQRLSTDFIILNNVRLMAF